MGRSYSPSGFKLSCISYLEVPFFEENFEKGHSDTHCVKWVCWFGVIFKFAEKAPGEMRKLVIDLNLRRKIRADADSIFILSNDQTLLFMNMYLVLDNCNPCLNYAYTFK